MKYNYIFTNNDTPSWLSYLHCLVLSRLLFEPASDCRKANKDSDCIEKMAETKLSMQY